jgi:hypothetical protein
LAFLVEDLLKITQGHPGLHDDGHVGRVVGQHARQPGGLDDERRLGDAPAPGLLRPGAAEEQGPTGTAQQLGGLGDGGRPPTPSEVLLSMTVIANLTTAR